MNETDDNNNELGALAGSITVDEKNDHSVLELLADVLEARKSADPASSYVASLYSKGLDAILQKVGEEAVETILASKSGDKTQIVYETADLWFHCMVMLALHNLSPDDVLQELKRRFGFSGLGKSSSRDQ